MIEVTESNLEYVYFTRIFERLMKAIDIDPLPDSIEHIPEKLQPYIKLVYSKIGAKCKFISSVFQDETQPSFMIPTSNKLLLAFSGGKDSVSAVIIPTI